MFPGSSDSSYSFSYSSTESRKPDSNSEDSFLFSKRKSEGPAPETVVRKPQQDKRKKSFSYSDSSSSDDIFGPTTDTETSSTTTQDPSERRSDTKETAQQRMERLQRDYDENRIDIPPCREDGPQVLLIIDTNLASEEYEDYFGKIKRTNREVDRGKKKKREYTMCFAMSEVEEIYDFCLKNIDALRTYNGHPDKIRFVTNSNRASSCVGRQADPTKAGNNFVRYVREELELKDAPILVYYFMNTSCLSLRDEAHNVFCTREREVAEPYIVRGVLPK